MNKKVPKLKGELDNYLEEKKYSYGIIPIYKSDQDLYILCVKNHKSGQWGLPKGTPEKNERPIETTLRELEEETGIKEIEISEGKTFTEKYSFERDDILYHKTVTYFLGFVQEMVLNQENLVGVDELKWIKINEANKLFSFKELIYLCEKVEKYLKKFPIISEYKSLSGEIYRFEYFEADSVKYLQQDRILQVLITAFHNDKLLIVNNVNKSHKNIYYGLVGGSVERGESPEECLVRELKEESNMRPIDYKLIGFQKCLNISNPEKPVEYQLRYFALVEPIGEFRPDCDPDGDVTELLEIEPKDYREYFDWGEVGELIIKKALEMKNEKGK